MFGVGGVGEGEGEEHGQEPGAIGIPTPATAGAFQAQTLILTLEAGTGRYPGHVATGQANPGIRSGEGNTWRNSQRAADPAIMPYDGGQFVPAPGASTPIPLAVPVPVPGPVPGHSHIHAHHPHPHPHALPSHPHHAHVRAHAHASAGGPFGAMEQIETQASDLRFLAQVPVLNATPTPSSGPGPGVGPGGTPGGTPGVGVGASAAAAAGYDTTPQPQTQASPGSASVGENSAPSVSTSNANKRKSLDDGSTAAGKQTRSKRNRVSCPSFLCQFQVAMKPE